MYRTLILLLLFFGKVLVSSGSNINYSFTQLSIRQGLSQSSINSVLLDRTGTLWIATKNGLNNYSQKGLKTYQHNQENPNSLPGNYIYHIAEDLKGNIWVATQKGMAIYNKEHDYFSPINQRIVYSSLCVEGGVLFGSDNMISRYDYKKKSFEHIYIEKKKTVIRYSDYRVQRMIHLDKNKILIGTKEKGIYLYDYSKQQLTRFSQGNHLLISLYIASDQLIYASFYGDGLYIYDKTGKIRNHFTTTNSQLKSNYILDIVEHKGSLWMATDGCGINLLKMGSENFTQISHVAGDNSSLPENSITVLYKDKNENLWAGSVRGGIFNIKETYIKTYKDVPLNKTNGLSEKSVISLYEEENGKLWIGTDGGGINLYDPNIDKFIHFPLTYGDKVISITGFSDTELMVSLYTKGIFIFNKKTGRYRPFIIVNDKINYKECFYGYLPLANQIADDKIYIISYNAYIYNPKTRTFSRMHIDRNRNHSADAPCLSYSNNEFSLLKCDNQAFIVNQKDDRANLLFEVGKNEKISSMTCDKNRFIWFGTDKGLGYFDLKEKKCHYIRTKLFNSVSFLTSDGKGRLWICAQNMLFSYIIKENKFTIWNSSDGFLPNEILFTYQKPTRRNFIYLGGADGLVKINTEIPNPHTKIPEIYLADINFNGCPLSTNAGDNRIKIPWDYNSLSIRFGIKNNDLFQKNLLRYTIAGRTNQHIESYDPVLNLSSLSPGTYEIWVSCSTKNGNYTKPIRLVDLSITPPWYKSSWFIGIIGLFFVCITVGTSYVAYRRKEQDMRGSMTHFLEAALYNILKNKVEKHQLHDSPSSMESSQEPFISKQDEEFLMRLNNIIHQHLSGEDLSIKFLTDAMAMSRASLYNKVKILTGLGVNDYINRIRIEKSVYLLTNTDLSISEIAYEVGFSYPRYFSTSFKQLKGVTPTRFKEENKSKRNN